MHLANHDVTLGAISRAPLLDIQAYKKRMGWSFPWSSSYGSQFNYDFQAGLTKEQQNSGASEYNFRVSDMRPSEDTAQDATESENPGDLGKDHAASCGVDWATYMRELPGVSAFVLDDGVVYHTYSAYARGLDGLWGMYQWLDRTPFGREPDRWFRRHDEYDRR